jgi:predicted amidohydrolase
MGMAQLTSGDNVEHNLQTVERLLIQAAKDGADLLVLPENTLFFRIRSGASVVGLKWAGSEMQQLQSMAERTDTALMLTTALAAPGDGRIVNATLVFQGGTAPRHLYSKVHLFDVDVPGAPPVRESESFVAGLSPAIWEFKGWKLGLSICYDLRFSELYLSYAQNADVILIPSAFLVPTGEAHWHTLVRARAIECQSYVVAPAQSGEHRSGMQVRQTFGHSLMVDPWGRILCELNGTDQVRVMDFNRDMILKVRAQIPMASHRRLKPV